MGKPTGNPRGRPKGSKNTHTVTRERRIARKAKIIESELPDAFLGDSHALLMLVYKDKTHPLDVRLEAAKAAIAYEKPRLSSVQAHVNASVDIRKWLSEAD